MITIQGWVSISGGGQLRASKRRSSLAIHSANKFRAFLILGCLVTLAVGPRADVAAADCIDYGDYLHWEGSEGTPGYACGVAVSGTRAYVADCYFRLQIVPAQCEAGAGVRDEEPIALRPRLDVRPNPSSSHAFIHFTLGADGPVRASVHDIAGRRVRSICDFNFAAGSHEIFWDGNDDDGRAAPAGIYLVRIAGPEATMTARFLMIR